MCEQFSIEMPLEVMKEWLLAHYSIKDVDKEYVLWYNPQNDTLNLEPKEWLKTDEVRIEENGGSSNPQGSFDFGGLGTTSGANAGISS